MGNYELRVEQEGFSTLVQSNIPVKIGEAAVLNLALQIGMATEVVEAKGAHKILLPTYYVLSHQVNYNELGDLYLDKLNQHHLKRNLVRCLERLGYKGYAGGERRMRQNPFTPR